MQVRRGSWEQACLPGEHSAEGGALDVWLGCREVWEQGLGWETGGCCQRRDVYRCTKQLMSHGDTMWKVKETGFTQPRTHCSLGRCLSKCLQ